ncbi:MAG: CpsD/CapB family tyrosine-protein kinase, partial [Ginsengibacter sp.]
RSLIAEQFRIFRTNMNFLTAQKKCPKILVTSSMTGEGKSFITANLGMVYAYSGKKVLLMEMDLRKPHLAKMLKCNTEKGFSNFIVSGDSIKEYVQPVTDNPNLFLLSSGPIPPNPAELLMSEALPAIFEKFSEQFDVIIMDSPPIGIVTDAQILSNYSDVNLFVVRERYTYKNSLEIIDDLLGNKKFANLYLIVNDVQRGSSYKYGYSYGYSYGYGYGNSNGYYSKKSKTKKTMLNKIVGK